MFMIQSIHIREHLRKSAPMSVLIYGILGELSLEKAGHESESMGKVITGHPPYGKSLFDV